MIMSRHVCALLGRTGMVAAVVMGVLYALSAQVGVRYFDVFDVLV